MESSRSTSADRGASPESRQHTGTGPVARAVLQLAGVLLFGAAAWFTATRWWWPESAAAGIPTPSPATFGRARPEGASAGAGGTSPAELPVRESETSGPATAPIAPAAPTDEAADVAVLRARDLLLPVAGYQRSRLRDDFTDARSGGRRHEALDLLAARDTPVIAVEDGTVAKLFRSEFGGITLYQFDREGRYCYYYAHLERYARGVTEGAELRRGETLGYVGTSGNAPKDAPHLHFAIYRLGPERQWWEGEPVNPFAVFAGR